MLSCPSTLQSAALALCLLPLSGCVTRNPGLCSHADLELRAAPTREVVETWAACESADYNADCKERMRQELIRRGAFTSGYPVIGDSEEVVMLCLGRLPDSKRVVNEHSPHVERWFYSLGGGLFAKDAWFVLTDGHVTEINDGRAGIPVPVMLPR